MRCPVKVVWDPRFLEYDFGEGHPFTERSRALATKLLDTTGFFRLKGHKKIGKVEPAPDGTLLNFHNPAFLAKVKRESVSAMPGFLDQGDTPAFPGVYEAASRIVSGTLTAARTALSKGSPHAVNFSGGLHHASHGRASGFCVMNDIGVTIATLLKEGRVDKVAYVDIDAHHGDGVMYGFYSDGRVLDIDFHQDGRTLFPGSGFVQETGEGEGKGLKVNVPLPPGAGDGILISLFERIVPPMLQDFKPDLLVLQSGIDGHTGDPLAHLNYTKSAYMTIVSTLHALAHELCSGRMVLLGGGGYSPASVSRTLAMEAMVLAGSKIPLDADPLPEPWREDFQQLMGTEAPRTWKESPPGDIPERKGDVDRKLLSDLSHYLERSF